MAQKFLSVRRSDYERIQTHKDNAPWIKLHRALFRDRDFLSVSTHHRYLYTGLLQLAYDSGNKIYNDPTYLGQMLYVSPTELDLKPLYRSGLLVTSNLHRTLSESESEQSSDKKEIADARGAPRPKFHATVYPEGFAFDERAEALATSYGINPHRELAAFRDHHAAKGTLFKDWQAAYRNWLRNAVKFAAKGTR